MRETANAQNALNRGGKEKANLSLMDPNGFMPNLDMLPDNIKQVIMDNMAMSQGMGAQSGQAGGLVGGPIKPLPEKGQPPRREGSR
jgi:hypothetical protein